MPQIARSCRKSRHPVKLRMSNAAGFLDFARNDIYDGSGTSAFWLKISTLRAFYVLERHYSATGESHSLVRNGNTRRDVSIIERIVEGAAEKDKRVPVMTCPDKGRTGAEAVTPPPRAVRPPIRVRS